MFSIDTETTRHIRALAKISLIANEYGVRSTQQFSLFSRCAELEGKCLSDIVALAADSPGYKSHYLILRQLMLGAANRGYNGANLFQWGDAVYGKERAILLTEKGRRLLKEIESQFLLAKAG